MLTRFTKSSHYLLAACLATLLAWGAPFPCSAADDAVPPVAKEGVPTDSALGVRQERVERMTDELQRRFAVLIAALQKTEPERAERLQKTLEEAKKMQLHDRMGQIKKMLDQASLDTAGDNQKAILTDIRALLALLLDEKSDRDKAREEYERLQEWKKNLENLIRDQTNEKRESEKVANKEQTLAALAAKIKAVEQLIAEQKATAEATQAARTEGIEKLGKIEGMQKQVRDKTEKLAEELAKEAGEQSGDKPAGDKPAGDKPAGDKPAGDKPSGEGGDAPPAGSPPPSSAPRTPEAGERPLKQAAASQKKAEENLSQGKGKNALQDEAAAVKELEQALAELKKEEKRIVSLPPEAFQKMAKKQDDLRERAAELAQKMADAAKAVEAKGQKPGSKPAAPPAGQQPVAQAQKSMENASAELKDQDPAAAARQQQKAIKELKKALEEIEERLAQLREETQLEKLAKIEARFREMLARQQQITADTAVLEEKRAAGEKLARTVHAPLARDERGLAEMAQATNDIIIEDGTSVVFPDVIEQLRDDLLAVGQLLEGKRTDAYTASMQKEIETTLQELIDALQKAQQQKEGGGGGGGGGGGKDEPLLPNSAELKLLRSAQMRVNRRTAALDAARGSAPADETLKTELDHVAKRQAEIGEMTIRILERE